MHDIIEIHNFAKERHQEMIANAAASRRIPQTNNNRFPQFSHLLRSFGQSLKSLVTVKSRPVLNLKS